VNQTGRIVNIPQVLATFYDGAGRIAWVSDAYVSRALLPDTPQPFAVALPNDLAPKVQSFRVTVNSFSWDEGK
jgi:hypothetical protein